VLMFINTVVNAKVYVTTSNNVLVFQKISCSGILVGFNHFPLAPLVVWRSAAMHGCKQLLSL
jgi:hypothetical protein